MQTLEPDRIIALKVWWALFWRSIVAAMAVTMALTTVAGILLALFGTSAERLQALIPVVARVIYTPTFILASVEVVRRVLSKKFADFEIALVPRQD